MEEAVGFEPTEPFGPLVFKTSSIDHSDTLPLKFWSTVLELNQPNRFCRPMPNRLANDA